MKKRRTWDTSDRKSRLPGNWESLRQKVLKRDQFLCQAFTSSGPCLKPASDVDHKQRGDDHSLGNLQSLCSEHHDAKTSREGHLAYMAMKREQRKRVEREFGNQDPHPGSIKRAPHKQPWEV